MRLAWAGVVTAGAGLVLAALLWTFGVTATPSTEPPVCHNRLDVEVPCEVLGIDMAWANLAAPLVLVLSGAVAVASIRAGSRPPRRRR